MTTINAKRVEWARAALDRFNAVCANDPPEEQPEQVIGDLITDCLHLARSLGVDTERLTTRAIGNFYGEIAEEMTEKANAQ